MKKTFFALLLAAASIQANAAPVSYLETFQGMSGELCDQLTDICANDTPDHAFTLRYHIYPPMNYATSAGFQVNTGWIEISPYDTNARMAVKRLSFTINALTPPAAYGTITLSIWDEATSSYIPYRNYTMLPNRTKTVYYPTTTAPEMANLNRFQLSTTNPVTRFTVNAMNADLY